MRYTPYVRVYATTTADEPSTTQLDPEATQLVADLCSAGYEPDIALLNIGSTAHGISWVRHREQASIPDSESRLPAVWAELGPAFLMRCGYSEDIKQEVLQRLDTLANAEPAMPMSQQGVTIYAHAMSAPSMDLIRELKKAGISPRIRHCESAAVDYERAGVRHHKEVVELGGRSTGHSSSVMKGYMFYTPLTWAVVGDQELVIAGYNAATVMMIQIFLGHEVDRNEFLSLPEIREYLQRRESGEL